MSQLSLQDLMISVRHNLTDEQKLVKILQDLYFIKQELDKYTHNQSSEFTFQTLHESVVLSTWITEVLNNDPITPQMLNLLTPTEQLALSDHITVITSQLKNISNRIDLFRCSKC